MTFIKSLGEMNSGAFYICRTVQHPFRLRGCYAYRTAETAEPYSIPSIGILRSTHIIPA